MTGELAHGASPGERGVEPSHQEHAAIAPTLACSDDPRGGGPLQVELAAAEMDPGLDVPRARDDLHVAVLDAPCRLASIDGHPRHERGAIEQEHRILRGVTGCLRRARR